MSLELPKQSCSSYAKFLECLKPFSIKQMVDTSIRFGSPEPLAVILKNSPNLKSIHLRNNSSDFILNHIGKNCPNIEYFIVEDLFGILVVSEEYLFRTFFKGIKKEKLLTYIDKNSEELLSFPSLKCIDVGQSNKIFDFLYYIQYFYKKIQSISCKSKNFPPELSLMKMPSSLLQQNFVFYINDMCLTSHSLMSVDINNIISMFPHVKHITLSIDKLHKDTYKVAIEKSIHIIKMLNCFSLTIHIQFDSENDEVLFDIYSEILKEVGCQLKSLQFHIVRVVSWHVLIHLINLCPNLELIGINIAKSSSLSDRYGIVPKIKPLKSLTSSSVFYEEEHSLCNFLEHIQDIIFACGKLQNLELFLPHTACNWLMSFAIVGNISSVKKLVLGLKYVISTSQPDLDFYVPLIEALPCLTSLILVKVPDIILYELKKVFKITRLEIKSSCDSFIAYIGLHTKFKF